MTHHVDCTSAAERDIKKLPRDAQERVLIAIEKLGSNPRPVGTTKLAGEKTAWRIRVGDYRVIYDIYDKLVTVTIVRVVHRREVYENLPH